MSELKLPRLLAAAKEFNIGQDTLIEFLVKKGFPKDDLKPTAKLTEDQYYSLQAEFQSDKVARNKADHVELPKNAVADKDKAKKPLVAEPEAAKPVAKEVEKPKISKAAEKKVEEPAKVKIDAPEVESPKVVDKIDLSLIDSSTRPKKSAKKTEETADKPAKENTGKKPLKKEDSAVKPEKETRAPIDHSISPENVHGKIENIATKKLEGPKVMGKIDLPTNSDTRPKPLSQEEKRKRKRIPSQGQQGSQQVGGQAQGAGQRPGSGYQGQGGGQRTGGYQGQSGGQRPGAGARGGNRNTPQTAEQKEIGQKAIQDKIKETQAKLAGAGGRGKSLKSKYRRAKRDEAAENETNEVTDNKLQVTEFVTVSELSSLMDVSFADIISKCMNLGIMVSINQRLDAEVIELVASEFGFEVEFVGLEEAVEMDEEEEADDLANLVERPPIVTIMGHVDHGKTSLLDYIRNANVVAGEAGGITQHIGAYEVTLPNGKAITFLDTPGHEAFTAMRARGAKVTDIAIIVVAADDAVMPQTKEAISHAQAANVPMIFAVNKIDKDGANAQKIYEQLSQMNILVEAWGGKFQNQELSAKQGLNVDALLEKVILESDLLELKANPNKEGSGSIIEASLDKGRGYVATILVQNGTLKQGDLILSGQFYGRVKAMFNERNQRIEVAPPSTPVVILGLNGAPQAGEKFKVYEDEAEAKELATKRAQLLREQGLRTRKHITLDEIGRRLALGNFKELNIIIKGDVDGSVEALSDSLQKLSTEEIAIRVILKGVGQISESDVLLSAASDAIIIGFNVRPSMQANKLAETEGVEIKLYSIIYNAIDEIKSAMEGMLEPKIQEKIVANVEVREVYKFDKATVAGCFVLDGKLSRNSKIRIIRDGIVEYPKGEGQSAELGSLKRFKDDVKDVVSNMECGLTIKNFIDLKVGDIVEAFEEEEVKRTL
ncbi:MAG: translation initiation factor IF-2 [Chitinophagia bacterium]|jgi:translation initiation factor IF-2|nr:translation initiation factor IF-2 [Chitinophagia bacterium]NCA29943.1 translation initiation factor IF-2 [Chitinophagia bacterium]NDD15954.1 translation initiation factor IF-2 [Chitinophagia bacterium]